MTSARFMVKVQFISGARAHKHTHAHARTRFLPFPAYSDVAAERAKQQQMKNLLTLQSQPLTRVCMRVCVRERQVRGKFPIDVVRNILFKCAEKASA